MCQSIGVDLVLRVLRRLCLRDGQLLPYIAGEIFVCGQVLFIYALGVVGVEKHHAGQLGKQRFLVLIGELAHVVHIHMGFFPNGQRQRLHRRVYLFSGFVVADGTLGEQVGLVFQIPVLVQNFQ